MNMRLGRSTGISLLSVRPSRQLPQHPLQALASQSSHIAKEVEQLLPLGVVEGAWYLVQRLRSGTGISYLLHQEPPISCYYGYAPSSVVNSHSERCREFRTWTRNDKVTPRSGGGDRRKETPYARRTAGPLLEVEGKDPGVRERRGFAKPDFADDERREFSRYDRSDGERREVRGHDRAGEGRRDDSRFGHGNDDRRGFSRYSSGTQVKDLADDVPGYRSELTRPREMREPLGDEKQAWQIRAEKRLSRHRYDEGPSRDEAFRPPSEERERWYRKKVVDLAVQIKTLKPAAIVLLLNSQRPWIQQEHVTGIVYNLVEHGDSRRALRALRWMLQRTEWYHADYNLYTKLMEGLLRDKKVKKAMEVYEIAINHGMKPEASTYIAFLHKLTKEGEVEVAAALDMYKSMKDFAGHPPPPGVQRRLIRMLCMSGYGNKYSRQAARILQDMQDAGTELKDEDFADVASAMATAGDSMSLDALIDQMKNQGLEPGPHVLASQLRACGKDGRVEKAKAVHQEMLGKGLEIISSNLEDMLLSCQVAFNWKEAVSIFENLTKAGVRATPLAYSILIKTLSRGNNTAKAETLLKEMEGKSLHHKELLRDTYNSVMHAYAIMGNVDTVDSLYHRFEALRLKPNMETFRMRLKALVRAGRLSDARAVYDRMWAPGAVRPDMDTFNLMIEAYGEASSKVDVRAIWEHVQHLPGKLELSPKAAGFVKWALSKEEVKTELAKRLRGKLGDEHKETLIGLLLGGANMVSPDKDRTYEFVFTADQGDKQREAVVHHVHRLMQDWCETPPSVVPLSTLKLPEQTSEAAEEGEGEKGEGEKAGEAMGASSGLEMEEGGGEVEGVEEEGDKEVLHLRTMNHGSFRFYAHQFHPEEKNVIPRLIHRWLAPRSLAFWYMYGGYRCPTTGGVVLKSHSYGTKEVTLVTNALKKRQMSAERKLTKSGNIIRIEGKSATWFWRLVYPHVLPELHEVLEPASAPLDSNGVGFTFRDDPDRNRYKLKKMRALEAEAKRREEAASERPFSQRSSAW